ncbi:hypothetical protein PVAND_003165 [Polypedilum vanderplanki]|uniref:Odorant receptor n=1 Tax=Polypedilum vanderplanki TaxID=319348 RepID=A0A9J6BTM9_POLVA|nr:hypothetical protein PVAND_003165 [Polypedilum vanderplanki]
MHSFALYSHSIFFVRHSEVNFEDFFRISSRMMRFCGYNLQCLSDCVGENECRILILKNVWFWTSPFSGATLISLILFEAWQSHDMGKLALAISTALSFSVYIFIASEFQRNRGKIFNFFEELKQDFPTRNHITRNAYLVTHKLSVVFICLWVFLNLLLWFVPFVYFLLFDQKILFYPLPDLLLKDVVYPLAYLSINISEFFVVLQYFGLTLIIITLIFIVCIKFDQLAHDLNGLKHLDETEVLNLLPTLIGQHTCALESARKFDGLFSVIFLLRFIVSIFAIGIDFFAILSLKNPSEISLDCGLIMSELNQIFLICCVGQMILNANNRITVAIYNCGWENWTSLSLKKSILMILEKSQDPATLTIWKFGSISLQLFTSLAKSMYDITSFLLAIYEK